MPFARDYVKFTGGFHIGESGMSHRAAHKENAVEK
jgi:hypothetical protein